MKLNNSAVGDQVKLSDLCTGKRPYFMLAALSIILYSFSLTGDFVYDDIPITVVENPALSGEASVLEVLSWDRPLREFTYMFDHAIWGFNPIGYHLQNILWHMVNVLLLYGFFILLGISPLVSLAVVLLYTVHPIHTESVAWISGRKELICFFFEILTCYLVILAVSFDKTSKRQWLYYGGSILSCLLALLSKQVAVSLPLLMLISLWLHSALNKTAQNCKRWLIFIIPHAILTLIFLFLSYDILEALGIIQDRGTFYDPASRDVHYNLLSACLTPFATFYKSIWLSLWPMDLTIERGFQPVTSMMDIRWISGLVIMVCLALVSCLHYRKSPTILFGLLWFFISWGPVSGFLPVGYLLADRYLYIPYLGLILVWIELATLITRRIRLNYKVAFMLFVMIIACFSIRTVIRICDWQSEISLWQAATASRPQLAKPYISLGNAYSRQQQFEKAFQAWDKALKLNPDLPQVWVNRGNAEKRLDNLGEAETCYLRAIELKPDYGTAHYNLGILYKDQGKTEQALFHLNLAAKHLYTRRAVKRRKALAHYHIARLLHQTNDPQQARFHIRHAESLAPMYPPIHVLKGMLTSDPQSARHAFQTAIQLDPNYDEAFFNLGVLEWRLGNKKKAEQLWQKAMRLNPALEKKILPLKRNS